MNIRKALIVDLILFTSLACLFFVISPWLIYQKGTDLIYSDLEAVANYEVAIVFGAGVTASGQPSDALRDRLDTALDLYQLGRLEHVLVSGDNSEEIYNEPDVMRDYLIAWGVAEEDVTADYAGRRTYDTCARANEIWNIEKALLISQGYHLPRAIYLCESFGIESTGLSASRQDYVYQDDYEFREILALYKAVLDVWLLHPDYIGGEVEEL
ncbi:MAG: SanA protein [Oceanicoccus sp.]|jgi:SanA protein